MRLLPCVLLLIMSACISTSSSRSQSNRAVSDHKFVETTDLSKAFDTTDEKELTIAEESLNTIDQQYDDASFPYPVSDIDAQNVLVCVRGIVERRLGGFEGTRKAGGFLADLDHQLEVEKSAREVLARCEAYRGQASVDPIDRNEQAKYIAKLRTNSGSIPIKTKITLYRFVKPTTSCWAAGLVADAGLLAAAGADGSLEFCSANNGRRWIQVALEGKVGYGAGGVGLIKLGRYRYRMSYLGGPFTYTKVREKKWAVGFGMSEKEMGEDYQHRQKGIIIALPSRRANRNMLGLGLGYFKTWGMRGGFKFLPLGTSKKGMLKEFRSLSRKDLLAEEATLQHVLSDQGAYLLRVTSGVDSSGNDPKVKFTLCSKDSGECEDLFAGKYFSVEKMQANVEAIHRSVEHLEGVQRADSIKTALYASLALSFAGTVTVNQVLNQLTTEGHIAPGVWKGNRAYKPPTDRGIKWFNFFEPLNNFLQKAADSKPMLALRDFSRKAIDGWNKMFNNNKAPSFVSNNFFRLGIPGVAVVAGGVLAMISGVKAERGEFLVRTYHNIADKQDQVISAIPDADREILISSGSKDDFFRALLSLTSGAEVSE